MTPDAFLRDIVENPDDDVPRLVLADWLEDHGQPGRAEFIRTQVQLSRLEEYDPRRPALEARERELLANGAAAWLGGIERWCVRWQFRRGLLCPTISAEVLAKAHSQAEGWAWVEEVCLVEVSVRALVRLRDAPLVRRLAAVDFSQCGLKLAGARVLAESSWLANLRTLNLNGNNIGNKGAAALAASPFVANLRSLNLAQNRLGVDAARAIASSPHLAELVSLDLERNSVGFEGLSAALASSPPERPAAAKPAPQRRGPCRCARPGCLASPGPPPSAVAGGQ
jgi:uncharacterized protein (TIGR02996 family)